MIYIVDNAKEDWLNTEVEAAQQVPAAYLHILLHHVEAQYLMFQMP